MSPWLLGCTNKIRLREVAQYWNSSKGMIGSGILEHRSPGGVLKNDTMGPDVDIHSEKKRGKAWLHNNFELR